MENKIEIPVELPEFIKKHLELTDSKHPGHARWGNWQPNFTFTLKTLSDYNFWMAYKETILDGIDKAVFAVTGVMASYVDIQFTLSLSKQNQRHVLNASVWTGLMTGECTERMGYSIWKLHHRRNDQRHSRLQWCCL